ncbi:MAG: SIMPL domain-containing protein [Clostridia bacterium]|jgi:uncharacterized protein YggE|nr:SIMPL domain-containing protein [Clostridia bacterium]
MKKTTVFIALSLILILFAGCAASAPISPDNIQTIHATGTGKIITEPDTVELRLNVITEGKTKAVQEDNAQKAQKTIEALIALGLTKDDIETGNLRFEPVYSWSNNTQKLVGYRAGNTLIVKTKQLDLTGPIADTAIQSGAEMVGNLSFSLSDEGKAALLGEIMEKAVLDARNQADLASAAAGVKITGVQNITVIKEAQGPILYNERLNYAKAMDTAAVTPILPEDTEYIVTVQATFTIK